MGKKTREKTARTSKNWCSCGFKVRGTNHEKGRHHQGLKTGK